VPAESGEIRYFSVIDGKEIEVPDGEPFEHNGEIVTPQSRTFIHARLKDNPYLVGTGYLATLQALPEPLRSQLLHGDFSAGVEDDPMQVCPTSWIDAAMDRWTDRRPRGRMLTMGVDVARGGKDSTVIARRHEGMWFDQPLTYQGEQTADGPKVAGLVLAARRDSAAVLIDVIGVGSSPFDFLRSTTRGTVIGVNVSEQAGGADKSGRLRFKNQRSELLWRMREALDPANDTGICLPPDKRLRADLCSFTWELQGSTIYVHSREQIAKRIGRSPDFASAYVLALMQVPVFNTNVDDREAERERQAVLAYEPTSRFLS
jgi:hypothetical protein